MKLTRRTPNTVSLTYASFSDLQDAVSRILAGQPVDFDEPATASGEVFVRLCIWGEPTARGAFAATLLRSAGGSNCILQLNDVASRRLVRSLLFPRDGTRRRAG